ncbi:DUF169 domain-containing protein [Peptococcaceae bacterium 1198_IL3148]
MESKIAQAIDMKYSPVAVMLTDEKPESALQFKEGRWGCVVAMMSAASKGKTAVFDRKTYGCIGGGTGLGFGNTYVNFPGGIEYFLSTGNPDFCNSEMGKNIVRNMPALEHGEGYIKNPELAKKFIDSLPMVDVPTEYVVFKPIEQVAEGETPKVVVFMANPDQLSALVVLANYAREDNLNVVAPFGAGCHSVCIIPYKEEESETPRAIIGLTDISARKCVDKNVLSFTVPYKMFLEMESNVAGSFLEMNEWLRIKERNK